MAHLERQFLPGMSWTTAANGTSTISARSARLNLHRPTTRNSARHGHSRTCGHFGRGTIFAKPGGWTSCYKRRKHMAAGNYGTPHLMAEEMREKGLGVFENRSDEGRGGKECVSTVETRWSQYPKKKQI